MKVSRGDKIIAIDLGGTNVRVALIKNRKILKYLKERTPKTFVEIKEKFLNLWEVICLTR